MSITRSSSGDAILAFPPLANLRFEVSRLLPAVSSDSDVATTPRALERKLLSHPGHEFGLWRRDGSRTTLRTRPPLITSDREYTPARSADKHLPEAHPHGSSILSSAVTATGTTVCAAWTSGTAK